MNIEKLYAGLKALGVRGKVTLKRHDTWTIAVSVNGKAYGLWGIKKNDFCSLKKEEAFT